MELEDFGSGYTVYSDDRRDIGTILREEVAHQTYDPLDGTEIVETVTRWEARLPGEAGIVQQGYGPMFKTPQEAAEYLAGWAR